MAIALSLGWPVLRLTGYFLALATLALSIIGNALFYEWDWLTGGELGIGGIPKLEVFGFSARYAAAASTTSPGWWRSPACCSPPISRAAAPV